MAFDYKKECKELYQPPKTPELITVPPITYVAVRGKGDPNEEDGAYQHALTLLYGLSYTIKMSPKAGKDLAGYFAYVVPPLEGFWDIPDEDVFSSAIRNGRKSDLSWISCIRLPEFVTPEVFAWAKEEVARKKGLDPSPAEMLTVDEGLCVQTMHIGSYDDEPATIETMRSYAEGEGYRFDMGPKRLHHEIYLSDPRRVAPDRLKTVIRIPVAQSEN